MGAATMIAALAWGALMLREREPVDASPSHDGQRRNR
jgi:hypothetical protein